MGVVPAGEGFPRRCCASALRRARRAARVRRGDQRLSRRARRRAGALRRRARPRRARQGARRRTSARRGGRPARADGAARAVGGHLSGGHAVGQPARDGGRARDAARSWTPTPTSGSSGYTERLADGLREAARDAGVPAQVAVVCGLADGLLLRATRSTSWEQARAADADAFARFFDAMLERGVYLPPSAVRGLVPLAGARRGRARPHARGGGRVLRGAGRDERSPPCTRLHALCSRPRTACSRGRSVDAAPADARRLRPAGGGRRARARRPPPSTSCWSRASSRATCCTSRRARIVVARRRRPAAARRRPPLRARASRGWRSSATSTPSRSWPT